MTSTTDTMVWHNDHHAIHLRLDKDQLTITQVDCPGENHETTPACGGVNDCIVSWFLLRFGLECNVGIAPPSAVMPIAWSVVGDATDLDNCQVWIIPIEDEAFAAWLMSVENQP